MNDNKSCCCWYIVASLIAMLALIAAGIWALAQRWPQEASALAAGVLVIVIVAAAVGEFRGRQ